MSEELKAMQETMTTYEKVRKEFYNTLKPYYKSWNHVIDGLIHDGNRAYANLRFYTDGHNDNLTQARRNLEELLKYLHIMQFILRLESEI